MKNNPSSRMAVLIDGDNVSPNAIGEVINYVTQYGHPTVKRIYGDCTKPAMEKWIDTARENSFRLIESLENVKGKNATDIALVVDAMDILYSGTVDGFCIVSSDGDFTLLAQRIRESGLLVLGWGESKTPVSFVNSCKKFMFSEMEQKKPSIQEKLLQRDEALFEEAFEMAANGNSEVALSVIGTELKKLLPNYKPLHYGCKSLGAIYQKMEKYELIKTGSKKVKNKTVRKKETEN